MKDGVIDCICKCLLVNPEDVYNWSNFEDDLNINDLDILDITISIESRFDINISHSEIKAISIVQDIIYLVESKTS